MKILAIETSCDETAIAILECSGELPVPEFKVLGNSLLSQIHIHKDYGGVYPMLAKREHQKNLPILLEQTLKEAEIHLTPSPSPKLGEGLGRGQLVDSIDLIAVTAGPGLEPALWTGIVFAEELGKKWSAGGRKVPVIPVNHMEGHLFSYLFEKGMPIEFPAIALLVSGGHTELVLVEDFDKLQIIGRTRDDAVGEAFDKVARLLGLPFPGGPKISGLAEISRARLGEPRFVFPRPMIDSKDFDFSYSGLKTAVLYTIKKLSELDMSTKEDLAAAFEDAAIEPLIEKTKRAIDKFGAKTLLVGGGVSANHLLREKLVLLAMECSVDLRLPQPQLTTDNAIMIGIAAYLRVITNRTDTQGQIVAKGQLDL